MDCIFEVEKQNNQLKRTSMQRNKLSYNGQKIFIGIDVHKNLWGVAVVCEGGFEDYHTQEPSAEKLFEFLQKHYPDGEYHAVYESGFSGFSTYYSLVELGIDCMVINAADVPTTQYEHTMKTDQIDARKLARSLKSGLLRGIYIHSKENIDARSVVRIRRTIQKQLGGCKSRTKHLLHSNGVTIPERFNKSGSYWSRVFIKWLQEDVQLLSPTRDSLDLLLEQVSVIRSTLLRANRKVRELSRSQLYRTRYELLTSVPGIGLNTAMALLTEVGDFGRFHNEREFASFLGLIPTCHSSGEKTSHGEKTFRGNKTIGPMIVEAAWVSITRERGLNCAYSNYRQKMKPQEAIIRIARKLANIIFAVMKTETQYVPYQWINT